MKTWRLVLIVTDDGQSDTTGKGQDYLSEAEILETFVKVDSPAGVAVHESTIEEVP